MEMLRQKEVAIQCLEKLDIYKPYIRKFKSKAGTPCFFENFAGFWADQEQKLFSKIKEVEEEHGCWVYAITHEFLDGDEMWSMLCIPQEHDGADDLVFPCNPSSLTRDFYAFAYVWNVTNEHFSAFGDVVVRAAYGGLKRLG
jgi:hypothetical protein